MQHDGITPVKQTFSCILKACTHVGCLVIGRVLHDQICRSGETVDVVVGNALIDMYGKCGSLGEAQRVFDIMTECNVVSWSSLISGFSQHGHDQMAFELFEKMQFVGVLPDKVTFLCISKVCGHLKTVGGCFSIHKQIVRRGLEPDLTICNALLDMYCRCGSLVEAQKVFDSSVYRDVVTWSTLLCGYAQHGLGLRSTQLFSSMQLEGIKPDNLALSSALKACCGTGVIAQGRLLHDQIISCGLESDLVIGSTLVSMYAECGSLADAEEVFSKLTERDTVLWGTLIAACVEHGSKLSALDHHIKMQGVGLLPDRATLLFILRACGSLGAVEEARCVHQQTSLRGLDKEPSIGNAIVDAYAKCGQLREAHDVFSKLPYKDVVSWGSILTGYSRVGNWNSAFCCFENLKREGLQPDEVIFLGVLMACSHAGLLDAGRMHFKSMEEEHGLAPNAQHYNCMVDLLGRAGLLGEAEDMLRSSKSLHSDIVGWVSLLMGCKTYGNIEVGKRCFDEITFLDPSHASVYAVISTMYLDAHLLSNSSQMGELKKSNCVQKMPGIAWIEVKNRTHEFVVGCKMQQESLWMCQKLWSLTNQLKDKGYMPFVVSVVLDSWFDDYNDNEWISK